MWTQVNGQKSDKPGIHVHLLARGVLGRYLCLLLQDASQIPVPLGKLGLET